VMTKKETRSPTSDCQWVALPRPGETVVTDALSQTMP